MLKKLLFLFTALIAAVLVYAATRPDTFRVERRMLIKAPPEKILAEIRDFQRWRAWSPYESRDPGMKRSFSGAPSGAGARYAWEGDATVGAGGMEILVANNSRVTIRLDFFKPFEAHNIAEFKVLAREDGAGSDVSWSMEGEAPFFAKVIRVFFDMDHMLGQDFEAGLAKLKSLTEDTSIAAAVDGAVLPQQAP